MAQLKSELSMQAEQNGCHSAGQARFSNVFTTLDHIFTIRALVEEGRTHNKRIYCCIVDFKKVFDTISCAWLMQQLEARGVHKDMQ